MNTQKKTILERELILTYRTIHGCEVAMKQNRYFTNAAKKKLRGQLKAEYRRMYQIGLELWQEIYLRPKEP